MSLKRSGGKTASDDDGAATEGLQGAAGSEIDGGPTDEKRELVAFLAKLDSERYALVQSTIEQLRAGAPVERSTYRRIKEIDTQKNRLIVGRFTLLLRKNDPQVKLLVDQLLQI